MYVSSFNVILGDNVKKNTIQSNTNIYSECLSILNKYVLDLGGVLVDSNTARFISEEAFIEFINKLLNL